MKMKLNIYLLQLIRGQSIDGDSKCESIHNTAYLWVCLGCSLVGWVAAAVCDWWTLNTLQLPRQLTNLTSAASSDVKRTHL